MLTTHSKWLHMASPLRQTQTAMLIMAFLLNRLLVGTIRNVAVGGRCVIRAGFASSVKANE